MTPRRIARLLSLPEEAFNDVPYQDALGWAFLGGFGVDLVDLDSNVVPLAGALEKRWRDE